jgi:hypothetical protein
MPKGRTDGNFTRLRPSQKRVRQLLKQGKYDDISLTSYGRLGHFFDFIFRVGVLKIVHKLGIQKRGNGIDITHLALLWIAKALLGFKYVDNLKQMFKDRHLMRLCGFTPQQIENGYSRRTTKRGLKPVHTDSVRNFGSSLPTKLSEQFFTEIVQMVRDRNLIQGGVFALDAKYVSVEGDKFEFAELGYDPHTNRYKKGYKLFLLQNIQRGHQYIVCAALKPGTQDERAMLLPMVEKAIEVLGKGVIKLLLIDRGYLDATSLYKLKHEYGIDFIIPGEDRLEVVKDALKLSDGTYFRHAFRQVKEGIEVAACYAMMSYESYADGAEKGTINVLLVKDTTISKKRENKDRIYSYLTSLSMQRGDSVEQLYEIYKLYLRRWVIENNAFKELTSYWNLTKMPGGKFNTICVHLFFTLAVYNLVLLFKTRYAQKLMDKSIMTLRSKLFSTPEMAVIYVEGFLGLFTLEELLKLLGRAPP